MSETQNQFSLTRAVSMNRRGAKKHILISRLMALLSRENRARLRRTLTEPLSFWFRRGLPRLSTIYGTDKWGVHWYATHNASLQRHPAQT